MNSNQVLLLIGGLVVLGIAGYFIYQEVDKVTGAVAASTSSVAKSTGGLNDLAGTVNKLLGGS
jgi:uncharacterized protein (UPF0333 family)